MHLLHGQPVRLRLGLCDNPEDLERKLLGVVGQAPVRNQRLDVRQMTMLVVVMVFMRMFVFVVVMMVMLVLAGEIHAEGIGGEAVRDRRAE